MLRTGMLGLGVGLAVYLSMRSEGPQILVITQVAVPVPIAITPPVTQQPPAPAPPAPAPAPPAPPAPTPPRGAAEPLGPCPAPVVDSTGAELHPPPDIHSIALAPYDVRLLAMWSDDALHISVDEGSSFQRVLDRSGEIGDVIFDCRGRLYAIRGDGELGTYDPRSKTERWIRVATFWSRDEEVDPGRLVLDGAAIAVIGNTPARRDRLWLVRRGGDGGWRARHLFSDREQEYWSGITVGSIRTLPGGRIRMMASPNMDDYGVAECGYAKRFEVTFDLSGGRIETRDHGEGDARVGARIQQDPAGRWLLLRDGRVERLTTDELADRLERSPAPAP